MPKPRSGLRRAAWHTGDRPRYEHKAARQKDLDKMNAGTPILNLRSGWLTVECPSDHDLLVFRLLVNYWKHGV